VRHLLSTETEEKHENNYMGEMCIVCGFHKKGAGPASSVAVDEPSAAVERPASVHVSIHLHRTGCLHLQCTPNPSMAYSNKIFVIYIAIWKEIRSDRYKNIHLNTESDL
jgi:hypothetical protein